MKKKILIVDDELAILKLLTKVFTQFDYEVKTALNGEEALEILKSYSSNLMLFDLKLPGISGIELCKKVKSQYPLTIIFAMTGYSSLFQLATCRDAGFEDYFKKPVEIKMLLDSVENAQKKIERWVKK